MRPAGIRLVAGSICSGPPPLVTEIERRAARLLAMPTNSASRLALLSLAALVIAVAGALLPASWAARGRPATALRAE